MAVKQATQSKLPPAAYTNLIVMMHAQAVYISRLPVQLGRPNRTHPAMVSDDCVAKTECHVRCRPTLGVAKSGKQMEREIEAFLPPTGYPGRDQARELMHPVLRSCTGVDHQ
jgi:hypothetical protein